MKKSELTKKTIKDSATKLLQAKSNFTFKEISNDCGVNVASINYHFGSKENLIECILKDKTEEMKTHILNAMSLEASSPSDSTRHAMENLYCFMSENNGIVKFLFNPDNTTVLTNIAITFMHLFSAESNFAKILQAKVSETSGIQDKERLKAKYYITLASLSFPIMVNLNIVDLSNSEIYLPDKSFGFVNNVYVDEIINFLLAK